MRRIVCKMPSPALVISCIALFVALSGVGYAKVVLSKNSVGTKQIRNGQVKAADLGANAVRGPKIANGQVTGADVDESTLGQVPSAANAATAGTAATAGDANLLDALDSTAFLRTNATINAVTTDGQSLTKIFFFPPGNQSFSGSTTLGGLTLSYNCDGEASGDIFVTVSTTADNAVLVVADDDSNFSDLDFDIADSPYDLETTLTVLEGKAARLIYRNGSQVVTAQFTSVNLGSAPGRCLVAGDAISEG
jgi:hypothetical protein